MMPALVMVSLERSLEGWPALVEETVFELRTVAAFARVMGLSLAEAGELTVVLQHGTPFPEE